MRRFFPFRFRLATVKSLQQALLTGMAVALIGTQTIGLHHRIEHGTATGWLAPLAVVASEHATAADHTSDSRSSVEHHCAAIDALALGDGPPASALPLSCATPASTRVVNDDHSARERSPASSFQARAPPVLS